MPHADTLYRLLRDIDVSHLEQAHLALIQRLIKRKTFRRYLIERSYPIAIDGSPKLRRDWLWDPNPLERTHGEGEHKRTRPTACMCAKRAWRFATA